MRPSPETTGNDRVVIRKLTGLIQRIDQSYSISIPKMDIPLTSLIQGEISEKEDMLRTVHAFFTWAEIAYKELKENLSKEDDVELGRFKVFLGDVLHEVRAAFVRSGHDSDYDDMFTRFITDSTDSEFFSDLVSAGDRITPIQSYILDPMQMPPASNVHLAETVDGRGSLPDGIQTEFTPTIALSGPSDDEAELLRRDTLDHRDAKRIPTGVREVYAASNQNEVSIGETPQHSGSVIVESNDDNPQYDTSLIEEPPANSGIPITPEVYQPDSYIPEQAYYPPQTPYYPYEAPPNVAYPNFLPVQKRTEQSRSILSFRTKMIIWAIGMASVGAYIGGEISKKIAPIQQKQNIASAASRSAERLTRTSFDREPKQTFRVAASGTLQNYIDYMCSHSSPVLCEGLKEAFKNTEIELTEFENKDLAVKFEFLRQLEKSIEENETASKRSKDIALNYVKAQRKHLQHYASKKKQWSSPEAARLLRGVKPEKSDK